MSTVVEMAKRNRALAGLIVAALGLLILNPFFYLGWQTADEAQAELEKEELMANMQLLNAQSKYDLAALQSELYELQSQVSELRSVAKFPAEAPAAGLYDVLAKTASWNGVMLVKITSMEKPGTEKIGDNEYQRTLVDLQVAGALSQIRSFLSSMEVGAYPTLEFEGVSLTRPEGSQNWEGALTMVVLSQP